MTIPVALTPACIPGGGGGHVVRCLALARALEREGAVCTFVTTALGVDLLARLGWTGAVAIAEEEAVRLAAVHAVKPGAVVVDDYTLDAAFERELSGVVLAIDDLADRPHVSALLLDSAYGRQDADYAAWAPGARRLLGPGYALLREGFAAPRREPSPRVERVFVCFGLSDVGGIAARAVRVLRPTLPEAAFDVALAADAPSVAVLRALKHPHVTIHLDADVPPLMRAADLGVGAGGGMVWERRAAGLPQLVVTLADNQRPMAARLAADGVIATVDLDAPGFDAALATAFTRLLDPAGRRAQIDCESGRCDGLGARRAARALLGMVTG